MKFAFIQNREDVNWVVLQTFASPRVEAFWGHCCALQEDVPDGQ